MNSDETPTADEPAPAPTAEAAEPPKEEEIDIDLNDPAAEDAAIKIQVRL